MEEGHVGPSDISNFAFMDPKPELQVACEISLYFQTACLVRESLINK